MFEQQAALLRYFCFYAQVTELTVLSSVIAGDPGALNPWDRDQDAGMLAWELDKVLLPNHVAIASIIIEEPSMDDTTLLACLKGRGARQGLRARGSEEKGDEAGCELHGESFCFVLYELHG